MSGKTIELFGQQLRLHDLWRAGVTAVPSQDGHDAGSHASVNLQVSDTTGMSLGFGASSYISSNNQFIGGNANIAGPVYFGVWAGVEAEVLHNFDLDKSRMGISAVALGIVPGAEVPIYLKAGLLDVSTTDSWSVTFGLSFSLEFLRSP